MHQQRKQLTLAVASFLPFPEWTFSGLKDCYSCFTVLAVVKDGKSGFSVAKGDFQPDKIQRSAEVAMVLSDVSKTMPR